MAEERRLAVSMARILVNSYQPPVGADVWLIGFRNVFDVPPTSSIAFALNCLNVYQIGMASTFSTRRWLRVRTGLTELSDKRISEDQAISRLGLAQDVLTIAATRRPWQVPLIDQVDPWMFMARNGNVRFFFSAKVRRTCLLDFCSHFRQEVCELLQDN